MSLSDGSGVITAKWFHFSERYIKGRFKKGKKAILSGEIKAYRLRKEIHHPEIEIVDHLREDDLGFGRIAPIYSETEGLHQKTLRKIMKNVVDSYAHLSFSGIPQKICQRLSLISLSDAVRKVHFPDDNDDIDQLNTGQSPAHRRLIFDEFFFLQLGLALKKKGVILARGIPFKIIYNYVNQLLKLLSFDLTRAQKRVISQIEEDMARPCPMNRLIQGDVGSGKTIVALIASLIARENGYQTAIMALTELLAEQHYLNIHYLTDQLKVRTELLTGRIKGTAREDLYRETRDGRVDITIGTHAIIEEAVEFKRLGLVIIDEQHRFGVIQRGRLRRKGANPDVLVMSKGSLKKGIKFFKARKIIESSLQLS
jgi:ATP-dependent DNA helicase RecG